jgi:hypothetical protein
MKELEWKTVIIYYFEPLPTIESAYKSQYYTLNLPLLLGHIWITDLWMPKHTITKQK